MKILTAQEIREVEKNSFAKYFSEAELMKKAGEKCFFAICKKYGEQLIGAKVSIVCGNGKNAGDGFVIASLLKRYGCEVEVILVDKVPQTAEPLMYFEQMKEDKINVFNIDEIGYIKSPFVVDCVFGIGFHGKAQQPFDTAFDMINESNAHIISIDIPSGVNATDGSVEGKCVSAEFTIAISTLKYGHILPPGNIYCGEVKTVDIGIPQDCYREKYAKTITKKEIAENFRPRALNSNKGNFGHQLNICSSQKMTGAGIICAKGALKTGVGLLKCAFPKSCYIPYASQLCESLFLPLAENSEKTFSMGCVNSLLPELDWADSIVVGCGIDVNDDTEVLVSQVLKKAKCPVVLDADGINIVSKRIELLEGIASTVVLTPHPGEMARLVGKDVSTVQKDRIGYAKTFAEKTKTIVVLKGANTIVTDGKEVFVNTTGNPGMAKAGTGDLLAGMIGSFIAQKMSPLEAAKTAVFVHGMCGDITARELSQRGMTSSDMAELLGAMMSEFE